MELTFQDYKRNRKLDFLWWHSNLKKYFPNKHCKPAEDYPDPSSMGAVISLTAVHTYSSVLGILNTQQDKENNSKATVPYFKECAFWQTTLRSKSTTVPRVRELSPQKGAFNKYAGAGRASLGNNPCLMGKLSLTLIPNSMALALNFRCN